MKNMKIANKTKKGLKKAAIIMFIIFAQTLFFGCDANYEQNDVTITWLDRQNIFDYSHMNLQSDKKTTTADFKPDIEYVSKVDMTIEKASLNLMLPKINCKLTVSLDEELSFSKSEEPVQTKAQISCTFKKQKNIKSDSFDKLDFRFKGVIDGKKHDINLKNVTEDEVIEKVKELKIGLK